MNKRALRLLAAALATGVMVVPFLGLDDLPRPLRARIDAERSAFSSAKQSLEGARREVSGDLRAEPELFQVRGMNTALPERLGKAETTFQSAARDMAALEALRKANRRGDRAQAERLLAEEQKLRAAAAGEGSSVEKEARYWVDLKRNLPQTLAGMDSDRQAVHADLGEVTAAVTRAATDWPEKKVDLEGRLNVLRAMPAAADKTWAESEPLRRKAAARDYAGLDYAALAAAAGGLNASATAFPGQVRELKTLTGQLYDGWDKLLVDLDRGDTREKLRTIRTHYTNVAEKKTEVTSDERWVTVSRAEFQGVERNLGMAIEHKAPGKYDSEAERVAQPAGFAYMARPAQERNQYGYWDQRGGQSFWVWYGQYALLRDLLYNRDYRAPNAREWDSYRTYRERGQSYYGRDETSQPKYGTQGTSTQSRYSGSTYAQKGGFGDSKYATRPGGYGGSKYESPGHRDHPEAAAPRRFGSSSPSGGFSAPSRPAPRSFSGGGRSFGGRRR